MAEKKKKKFCRTAGSRCLRGGKEGKLLHSVPQRKRAQTREITANDNFLQFFSSSVLQFFFQKGAFIVWCISRFPCVISTRETFLPKPRILSLSHSGWGDDFYTRARSRYIHRHMHRFDSMCTFDFNKSALELSFFVVARGFVLSWVGCLSSLSVSTARSCGNERTNEQKREKRVLSLKASSLASRIFLLSSSTGDEKVSPLFLLSSPYKRII